MFPYVDANDRDVRCGREMRENGVNKKKNTRTEERVLIGGCDDLEDFTVLVVSLSMKQRVSASGRASKRINGRGGRGVGTDQPTPAASLDRGGGRVELFLEAVKRPKVAVDGRFEQAVGEDPTSRVVWGEVLPEERVIDVTCRQGVGASFVSAGAIVRGN